MLSTERELSAALPFLWAAEKFAAASRRIVLIRIQLKKLPPCGDAVLSAAAGGSGAPCTDTMIGEESNGVIPWWLASDKQVSQLCAPCRARVLLWSQRRQERARMGGLKRSMLVAYRKWQATA